MAQHIYNGNANIVSQINVAGGGSFTRVYLDSAYHYGEWVGFSTVSHDSPSGIEILRGNGNGCVWRSGRPCVTKPTLGDLYLYIGDKVTACPDAEQDIRKELIVRVFKRIDGMYCWSWISQRVDGIVDLYAQPRYKMNKL